MTPYILLISLPIACALFASFFNKKTTYLLYIFILLILVIFVGLRHRVGGDWHIYLEAFYLLGEKNLFDIGSSYTSFTYYVIGQIFYKLGLNFYSLNLFLAIIFFSCFHKYIKNESDVFLAIIIALPYIILVSVMGYVRQGLAFGFILYSYTQLINDRKASFVFYTLVASTFHVTALLNFIFIFIFFDKINFKLLITLIVTSLLAYFFYKLEAYEIKRLFYNYLGEGKYLESTGANIRLYINAFPSIIFIFLASKLAKNYQEKRLYYMVSFLTISMFFVPSEYSTVVDRSVLYLNSIQIIVFSRLHSLLNNRYIALAKLFIIIYYGTFYFGFLMFSVHGPLGWLPYRSILTP